MKPFATLILLMSLLSILSWGQESSDFRPAETNVWGAEYPRVDNAGRVLIRVKAPDATKVKLNFWSGPKVDMEKQPDGFWTVTTPPLVPGLHYYTLIIDGAEVADTNSHAFSGEESTRVQLRFQSRALPIIRFKTCPTGRCVRFGTTRR